MSLDQWGFEELDEQAAATLPAGRNVWQIVAAKRVWEPGRGWWIGPRNPEASGFSIEMETTVNGQRHKTRESFPSHWKASVVKVSAAAGVPTPFQDTTLTPEAWAESLVGSFVSIDTVTTEPNERGQTYINVKGWHPGAKKALPPAPAEAPAPRAPRTPAAKAAAEFRETNGSDDIPF
jgi:hypothetical protein